MTVKGYFNYDPTIHRALANSRLRCGHEALAAPALASEEEQGVAGLARLQTFARLGWRHGETMGKSAKND